MPVNRYTPFDPLMKYDNAATNYSDQVVNWLYAVFLVFAVF